MNFTDLNIEISFNVYGAVFDWYGSPANDVIETKETLFLKNIAQGDGFIQSGSRFAKNETGQATPFAQIHCYIQTATQLEYVASTVSDINGIWTLGSLNKKYLYTIVAAFNGYEKVVLSNVYPI